MADEAGIGARLDKYLMEGASQAYKEWGLAGTLLKTLDDLGDKVEDVGEVVGFVTGAVLVGAPVGGAILYDNTAGEFIRGQQEKFFENATPSQLDRDLGNTGVEKGELEDVELFYGVFSPKIVLPFSMLQGQVAQIRKDLLSADDPHKVLIRIAENLLILALRNSNLSDEDKKELANIAKAPYTDRLRYIGTVKWIADYLLESELVNDVVDVGGEKVKTPILALDKHFLPSPPNNTETGKIKNKIDADIKTSNPRSGAGVLVSAELLNSPADINIDLTEWVDPAGRDTPRLQVIRTLIGIAPDGKYHPEIATTDTTTEFLRPGGLWEKLRDQLEPQLINPPRINTFAEWAAANPAAAEALRVAMFGMMFDLIDPTGAILKDLNDKAKEQFEKSKVAIPKGDLRQLGLRGEVGKSIEGDKARFEGQQLGPLLKDDKGKDISKPLLTVREIIYKYDKKKDKEELQKPIFPNDPRQFEQKWRDFSKNINQVYIALRAFAPVNAEMIELRDKLEAELEKMMQIIFTQLEVALNTAFDDKDEFAEFLQKLINLVAAGGGPEWLKVALKSRALAPTPNVNVLTPSDIAGIKVAPEYFRTLFDLAGFPKEPSVSNLESAASNLEKLVGDIKSVDTEFKEATRVPLTWAQLSVMTVENLEKATNPAARVQEKIGQVNSQVQVELIKIAEAFTQIPQINSGNLVNVLIDVQRSTAAAAPRSPDDEKKLLLKWNKLIVEVNKILKGLLRSTDRNNVRAQVIQIGQYPISADELNELNDKLDKILSPYQALINTQASGIFESPLPPAPGGPARTRIHARLYLDRLAEIGQREVLRMSAERNVFAPTDPQLDIRVKNFISSANRLIDTSGRPNIAKTDARYGEILAIVAADPDIARIDRPPWMMPVAFGDESRLIYYIITQLFKLPENASDEQLKAMATKIIEKFAPGAKTEDDRKDTLIAIQTLLREDLPTSPFIQALIDRLNP